MGFHVEQEDVLAKPVVKMVREYGGSKRSDDDREVLGYRFAGFSDGSATITFVKNEGATMFVRFTAEEWKKIAAAMGSSDRIELVPSATEIILPEESNG